MKIDAAAVRNCLKSFDFATLFREQLGWDNHQAHLDVPINGKTFRLTAVAQKRGFAAYVCSTIPDRAIRLKIDQQVTKSAREHFVIYADQSAGQQVWQWVRRETGKPLASRDHRFNCSQSGDPLIQRLEQIAVAMQEEDELTLLDVTSKAKSAFDVDKVTKKFYERFKAEHSAFMKFIKGIQATADLEWYASLMLNRLMFVYFIQKKGFLDGDADYLRHRMRLVREAKGNDKFQSFYRYFLLRLFHDGLGKSPEERKLDRELEKLLGKVPYLNGGFFEAHQLEERNAEIDIPDKAFAKLFEFFEDFRWHLDERPLRADNEINPDVVGYIFEKYINQKQMGAYYTKEDITEYISKNTIIPFLFDAAEKKCPIAFTPHSFLWRLLSDDPDRYIYAAVRHGVIDDAGNVLPLPKQIEAGVSDVAKREGWNKPACEPFALPTETWREHVARRTRCLELREKLNAGEVHAINDLITLNLDIWQFARDTIVNSEGPELLRAFWQAIEKVTVLDPTCGSGAFLFAALRILETLYSDCLERMERFVEDLSGKKHHPEKFHDFKAVLAQIAKHPSDRYFILKSIIVNNLFGVDIMEEAVEICKLRLFLKLVAQVETVEQIEPLPDIDFNIRSGNTLVGFTSLEEIRKSQEGRLAFSTAEIAKIEVQAASVDRQFKRFRALQTNRGHATSSASEIGAAKSALRSIQTELAKQLDDYLAGEYGIDKADKKQAKRFSAWCTSHRPFHWFVDFYGVLTCGGFDVIVGNPPYVNAAKARQSYEIKSYATAQCPDIYAWCLERVTRLGCETSRVGMIVPLSLTFSDDFACLRSLLYDSYSVNWFSSFGRIPSALFSYDVRVRNTIHLGSRSSANENEGAFASRLHRWFEEEREPLFSRIQYARFCPELWKQCIPKVGSEHLMRALEVLATRAACHVGYFIRPRTAHAPAASQVYFKKTAYNWLAFSRQPPPCYAASGEAIEQSQLDVIALTADAPSAALQLLLNSKIALCYWFALGDDFHVTKGVISQIPLPSISELQGHSGAFERAAHRLADAMQANISFKLNAGKRIGNFNLAKCRHVTDASDMLFIELFGLPEISDEIDLMYSQMIKTDFDTAEAEN